MLKTSLSYVLLFILGLLYFITTPVFAGSNFCTSVGGAKQYSFNMGTKNITDPSMDTAGTTFNDVYTWGTSGSFNAICDCTGKYTPNYKGTSHLPLGHQDAGNQYFKINDNIEVLTKISLVNTVLGTNYFPIPFEIRSKVTSTLCTGHNYASGSDGTISLYISKPFVGSSVINSTKIASLYVSAGDSFGSEPVAEITMSGLIVVPQNCVLNAGTAIVIDMGTVMAGDFKERGKIPENYKAKNVKFEIKCNNMAVAASLMVNLQATPSPELPSSIATSNKDIGVVIADSQGTPIGINTEGKGLPFTLNENLTSEIELKAWPTSTTDHVPAAGIYESTAQLNVSFN